MQIILHPTVYKKSTIINFSLIVTQSGYLQRQPAKNAALQYHTLPQKWYLCKRAHVIQNITFYRYSVENFVKFRLTHFHGNAHGLKQILHDTWVCSYFEHKYIILNIFILMEKTTPFLCSCIQENVSCNFIAERITIESNEDNSVLRITVALSLITFTPKDPSIPLTQSHLHPTDTAPWGVLNFSQLITIPVGCGRHILCKANFSRFFTKPWYV